MKYTAFISHSNRDEKAVQTVRNYLESLGYSCFVSDRDLKRNAEWQTQLVEAMDGSSMLIYLHSKDANGSPEVSREINYFADRCHRPILVYRLSDDAYCRDKAYYLQSINYIDSLSSPEEGLESLSENVRSTLEGMPGGKGKGASGRSGAGLWRIAVPSVLGVLIAAGLLFHLSEKSRMERYLKQSASLLDLSERKLAEEDSLEFVLAWIDEAQAVRNRCEGLLTVKAPSAPDFKQRKEEAVSAMTTVRSRRIETVKALYAPLKFSSSSSTPSSVALIRSNIDKLHVLDSVLNLGPDPEIESIANSISGL